MRLRALAGSTVKCLGKKVRVNLTTGGGERA